MPRPAKKQEDGKSASASEPAEEKPQQPKRVSQTEIYVNKVLQQKEMQQRQSRGSAAPQSLKVTKGDEGKSPEDVLKQFHFWEGWARAYKNIPLGPGHVLELPEHELPDPEVLGYAMPIAPVEYGLRNERKYPPPSDEDMWREMFKLVQYTLKRNVLKRTYTMSIIYNHINRNSRDSPGWQQAFIKARGPQFLLEIWRNPEPPEGKRTMGEQYWVLAVLGRMCGTSEDSRTALIKLGVPDIFLEGTRKEDENVKGCAIAALRGLVHYPDGRAAVSFEQLLTCMA
jgi:hypothetical protein